MNDNNYSNVSMADDTYADDAIVKATAEDSVEASEPTNSGSGKSGKKKAKPQPPTDESSPIKIAQRNWFGFFETLKKFSETELMALVSLSNAAIGMKEIDTTAMSKLGRNAINFYLNEGCTKEMVKDPLELANYRMRRVEGFFEKKMIPDNLRMKMQNILMYVAIESESVNSSFKLLPSSQFSVNS